MASNTNKNQTHGTHTTQHPGHSKKKKRVSKAEAELLRRRRKTSGHNNNNGGEKKIREKSAIQEKEILEGVYKDDQEEGGKMQNENIGDENLQLNEAPVPEKYPLKSTISAGLENKVDVYDTPQETKLENERKRVRRLKRKEKLGLTKSNQGRKALKISVSLVVSVVMINHVKHLFVIFIHMHGTKSTCH